ncbi:MAG: hypothetical protein JJT85_00575 [Chromatiales bacterium]|nr:hypothetical protein [Chromatiales bacterium]
MRLKSLLAATAAVMVMGSAHAGGHENPNAWVMNAPTDEERFELIQGQFGGYARAMWEIGHRFRGMRGALRNGNFELAQYHLEEMEEALDDGNQRRPRRAANSERFFPASLWKEVDEAFGSGDADKAWAAFDRVRNACMGCHVAENVEFMNRQPMFEDRGQRRQGRPGRE